MAPETACHAFGLRYYETADAEWMATTSLGIFCGLTLARFAVSFLFIRPLAQFATNDAKLATKFKEAAWRSVLYATTCIWSVKVAFYSNDAAWVYDSDLFWKDWPVHATTNEMALLYALYVGVYAHQLVFLFTDTPTSDFWALLAHHAITLFLVLGSWRLHFVRVGAFTMLLHDGSDVFLEIAKCFNYAKTAHPKFAGGADLAFVLFAASFFVLRIGVYPLRVVYSSWVDACSEVVCPALSNCSDSSAWMVFNALILVLQGLQIFWGWKIVVVVMGVLGGKELEDPREE